MPSPLARMRSSRRPHDLTTNDYWRLTTGALTLAYGAAVAARPGVLLRPARLTPTPGNTRLARAVGCRDILSGVSLVAAPRGLRGLAVGARVAADASDVLVFGVLCPPEAKAKAAGIAAGWGALCLMAHPANPVPAALRRLVAS